MGTIVAGRRGSSASGRREGGTLKVETSKEGFELEIKGKEEENRGRTRRAGCPTRREPAQSAHPPPGAECRAEPPIRGIRRPRRRG